MGGEPWLTARHAELVSASHMLSIRQETMLLKQGHIYIMSNQYRTTFYIGVTSDLRARVWQHLAIDREKQLKNWHHGWKVNLIKSANPEMRDLKFDIGYEE